MACHSRYECKVDLLVSKKTSYDDNEDLVVYKGGTARPSRPFWDEGLFLFGCFLKDCCFFNKFCVGKPFIKKLIGAEGARLLREQRDR
jgi:hypothetical protein